MAQAPRAVRWARVLLVLTLLAPLAAFVAVAGIKIGIWDWTVGYSLLAMRVGLAFAALGAVAALGGAIIALGDRRAWPFAVVGLIAGVATSTVYGLHIGSHGLPDSGPMLLADVTTNPGEPPVFAGALADRRTVAGAPTLTSGAFGSCEASTAPTQVAPSVAAYALQQAGFEVLGAGVGRADGTRTGFWFGFQHDAVIRIRPGQTDVRVSARQARPDGGEACRLLQTIVSNLQAP
ncbi:hypothetical protein IP78_00945 [Brevundimonas sp. AAP58]|uniref:DUF1499 domain-containing protein n=1 Tax=Brevundimonas sp. AAP58 TaxID=1523422 RepID=UPI0006B924CD|nr:DUF1499 domain-containing protein [Brevundimonas sp. AAP58]KPF84545.1 hypothetical protein IP78_00945 [Brevundimonas sp. AAP58]